MKNRFMKNKMVVLSAAVLMLACTSEKKEGKESGSSSVVENVGNLSKMSGAADKMEEMNKKLKTLKPLTNTELKAVVPETLGGLKRTSFSAGDALGGISTINAEYGDDAKNVKISILDGAGEAGSAVVSLMSMTLSMDTESEADGRITKTANVNGIRSITEEAKSEQEVSSSIKFLYKDRYSVNLDGKGYSLSELETFMKSINLNGLK